jgi:pyridoxamine 5'-phosphate oxidase
MPNRDLTAIRNHYQRDALDWDKLDSNPLVSIASWVEEAVSAKLYEPTAMTLATTDHNLQPHARIVLLKEIDAGLVFYTNYLSPKVQELAQNPRAACTLFWPELERQIRIEGMVEKVSTEQSDRYFASRPRDSQLGAWASRQGSLVADRQALEDNFHHFAQRFANQTIHRPDNWGGYRLVPNSVEFWQGRPNRLHDRLRFTLQNNHTWLRERLSP